MKRIDNNELLMDIRERTVAIETHLKDMNGRLSKHDTFLSETCPQKHTELDRKVTKVMTIMGIVMIVVVAIVDIIVRRYVGG